MSFIRPITGMRPERWDSAGTVSEKLEDEEKGRAYGVFAADQDNTVPIFLNLGADAVQDQGICIKPGGTFEMNDTNMSMLEIHAICSAAGQKLYYAIGIG